MQTGEGAAIAADIHRHFRAGGRRGAIAKEHLPVHRAASAKRQTDRFLTALRSKRDAGCLKAARRAGGARNGRHSITSEREAAKVRFTLRIRIHRHTSAEPHGRRSGRRAVRCADPDG